MDNIILIVIFVIGSLLSVIGFFSVFILTGIRKDITELFTHLENHSGRILKCEIEHNINES